MPTTLFLALILALAAPLDAQAKPGKQPVPKAESASSRIRSLAEQGHAEAQFNLGICYDQGGGVPQSQAEAAKWYRKAAEQGHATAQFNLGLCYARGEGIPQSHAEAAKWYRKAAEQGYAEAQFNLGFCYARGEGVPQSDAEAYIWFSLASARGMENAAKSRDIAAENLSPQALARAQARAAKLHAEIEARL